MASFFHIHFLFLFLFLFLFDFRMDQPHYAQNEYLKRANSNSLILFSPSGFITYVGPFNQEFRRDIMNKWLLDLTKKSIPLSSDLNPINFFADAPTISEWNLQGRHRLEPVAVAKRCKLRANL